MSEPTHISEYIDKHLNRIRKRNNKLKELETKYGKDVNARQLTEQELKDWIDLFNKKRGNNENNN
jgi:hypothetical protein|tara:strand:- start:2088 stop:2282 length:195 start_codon:yes stop_codon:yes gene_type:complete